MHNIKLTLAYDGTDFHGWQVQRGQPTIQGALTDVVRKLTGEKLTVHDAGRVRAGVQRVAAAGHPRARRRRGRTRIPRPLAGAGQDLPLPDLSWARRAAVRVALCPALSLSAVPAGDGRSRRGV